MKRTLSFLKTAALAALVLLTLIGVFPSAGQAAAGRDCDLTDNACFARVNDDGSITIYWLGNLLQEAE